MTPIRQASLVHAVRGRSRSYNVRQRLEGDLDPAYISALAAPAGATIGGLTSFATSWLTQRTQLRHVHREAERAELKTLYQDFITEDLREAPLPRLARTVHTPSAKDDPRSTGLGEGYAAALRLTHPSAISVSFLSVAFSSCRVCSRTLAHSWRPSCLASAIRVP